MLKVIVTGPESSGKTTLCNALAEHFNISFSVEVAREYLENNGKNYTQSDLLEIAKQQLEVEKAKTRNKNLSLHDTDLITIKIWSDYKYGNCSNWILEQIEDQKTEKRFYLLCKTDIPWEIDPLREHPKNREELFKIYNKELEKAGHPFFIIKGENRIKDSIEKITKLISKT